jgi:hypothetical protein
MNCSECEELFAAHLEGLLAEEAGRRLEAHLARCPACRTSLDETRRLIRRLGDDARGAPLSSIAPGVMDRIVHRQALQLKRSGMMKRNAQIAVAAAVLIGGVLALLNGMARPIGGRVHAAELAAARTQMEAARTAAWRISYYRRFSGPAGVGSRWFRIQNMSQRYTYKAPGLYRSENLDEDGKVTYVSIEDEASRSKLEIIHKTRTATLTRLVESSYPPEGPFERYLELMRREDLRSLGKEDVAGRPANGFRFEMRNGLLGEYRSVDFWLDAANKRLIRCQQPGREILDPAEIVRDRSWKISSGEKLEYEGKQFTVERGGGIVQGHIISEIAFDVEVDDAQFSLEPPAGYAFKRAEPPAITEKDVLDFMGIVAEYYDRTFPDRLPQFAQSSKEDLERLKRAQNAVHHKKGASPAEVKLVEAMERWYQTGIPGPGPLHVFVTYEITKGSWKYLGKGVKLGDKDRIVCWYRPKGSRTYRVVRGDLSVQDVAPEELPLPVER